MFKFQMENFINSIFKKEKINSDLFNAINTLKLCMKLKKMILSNKNILIIGAAGLIGSQVAKAILKEGARYF